MSIKIGDLVIFKYQRKNPNCKIGLVIKKEMRAMQPYGSWNRLLTLDDIPLSNSREEMCCYCIWTHIEHNSDNKGPRRWWAPERNLILYNERGNDNA